jgi:hypothetical protein
MIRYLLVILGFSSLIILPTYAINTSQWDECLYKYRKLQVADFSQIKSYFRYLSSTSRVIRVSKGNRRERLDFSEMLCPELMRKEPTIPPNLIVRSNLAAYLKFQWKHSSIHPNAMFWDYCDIYPLPPLNRKALLEDLCTIYENYGMDCGSRFTIAFFLQIDTLWHWLLIERSHFIHTGKPISELDKEIRQLIEKRVDYYAKLEPSFIFFRDAKEIISTVYSSHIEEFIREMEKDYWTSELTDHVYLSLKRIFNLNLTFDSYHFANFGIKLLRNYVADEYILSVSSILNLITYMSASRFLPSPQLISS